MERRQFLREVGALGAGLVLGATGTASPDRGDAVIPRRLLGRTGVQVSCLGLGGSHLGDVATEDEAMRIVAEAIDAGVTFMDNAWDYHDGLSEERMGRALRGRRDKVFLMTKVCTHGRDKATAMGMLEQSLRRLGTDHLDLWQIHEVVYENDPELIFRKGGVIEALTQAKQQGKVRFVGFTGHKDPSLHLRVLAHGYPFDTVQMPLNCFDASFRSFEQRVLPEATRNGLAVIGMKSLSGNGRAIQRGVVSVRDALRYAMSLPVATTVSGIDSLAVLRQNLAIARGFQALTAVEMQALRQRCAGAAADGRYEWYKTTSYFDGPEGRRQHGYPSRQELPL